MIDVPGKQYTQDYGLIEIATDKIDANLFTGKPIDIGTEISTERFIRMMSPIPRNRHNFKYPHGLIFKINVSIPELSITESFPHMLANFMFMIGKRLLLEPKTPPVSISPVTSQKASRTHLIATTTTGCRLYMSDVASEYGFR